MDQDFLIVNYFKKIIEMIITRIIQLPLTLYANCNFLHMCLFQNYSALLYCKCHLCLIDYVSV